jgi:hypothetical protein
VQNFVEREVCLAEVARDACQGLQVQHLAREKDAMHAGLCHLNDGTKVQNIRHNKLSSTVCRRICFIITLKTCAPTE